MLGAQTKASTFLSPYYWQAGSAGFVASADQTILSKLPVGDGCSRFDRSHWPFHRSFYWEGNSRSAQDNVIESSSRKSSFDYLIFWRLHSALSQFHDWNATPWGQRPSVGSLLFDWGFTWLTSCLIPMRAWDLNGQLTRALRTLFDACSAPSASGFGDGLSNLCKWNATTAWA